MRTPLFAWFILWVTIPIIIFFLFILPAYASDGPFYQRGQEGWFWYQVIPEPEQPDELVEPETGVVESSQSELKPFSAAWFREHMQSFMDKAIDEPTNENVRAYLYLQRVMMDKVHSLLMLVSRWSWAILFWMKSVADPWRPMLPIGWIEKLALNAM